jgi:hypothetical protein
MATTRLKAGQTVTIKTLPTGTGRHLKVGDQVKLSYFDSSTNQWAVTKGKDGPFYGFTRKNFDVPAMAAKKPTTATTAPAPINPTSMLVDAEFVKQAHAAACSAWKNKLEAKFPHLFKKELKAKKIVKATSIKGSDIIATITTEGATRTEQEKIYIGIGLAPYGHEGKCLSLSEYSEFKFELAKNGQCVILVPKKK